MIVYLNGKWLEEAEAAVSVQDRGFLFGDGVFESVRRHRGHYFRLRQHLRRLEQGAAALRIPLTQLESIQDAARELARRTGMEEGMLRVTVSRGAASGAPPTLLLTLRPMPADWSQQAERGWRLITAAVRHPPPESMPPQLKALGRMYPVLARLEAESAGVDDALLLSTSGEVAEGPSWNVFWRQGDRLCTPAAAVGILEGVTRAVLLEIAAELGYTVEQGRFPRAELDRAQEIFATMTSLGPVSILELDGRPLPPQAATAARRLRTRYWEQVEREAAQGLP
ncbi:MAG: aminotransferase class IV [Gemmatimonadetes bacterium]|nr:aminotransferase class IV [Gemmatimonadota bacterium]